MALINLLPQELSPKSPNARLAQSLRSVFIVGLVIFFIVAAGVVFLVITRSIALNNLNTRIAVLKTNISAIEQTEERLVLVKDRLTKIQAILSSGSVYDDIVNIDNMSGLGTNTNLTDIKLVPKVANVSFSLNSPVELTRLMGIVVINQAYKTIALTQFSYNPLSGFLVGLSFIN